MNVTHNANPLDAKLISSTRFISHLWTQHKVVLLILLVGLAMRVGDLGTIGHEDLRVYNAWSMTVAQHGLFSIYAQDPTANYAPIFLALTGAMASLWLSSGGSAVLEPGSGFLVLLKLFPLLAELGIILLAYAILPPRSRLRWIVPTLLAIYPGLIATTAFWGQTDSLFLLPLLACFVLLQRDHPRWAWVLMAVALLTKFQAVIVLPLLLVLTLRRYGWKSVVVNVFITGVIVLLVLAPFIAGSGLSPVLRLYFGAVDQFPGLSNNAFNFWYAVSPSVWNSHPPLLYEYPSDNQVLFASLTAKQLGLIMMGIYCLILLAVVYRRYKDKHEFIWLTALYFGFFMLPTQIHERYLYAAAVFSLLSVAEDRRMWAVALPMIFTFSYNVICPTQAPFYWLGINPLFILGDITLAVALLNILLFGAGFWILLKPAVDKGRHSFRLLWGVITVFMVMIALRVFIPTPLPQEITPLDATVDNTFRLHGYQLVKQVDSWSLELYWQAYAFNNHDYKLFVHAIRDGQTIAQDDARPQGGSYPTWRWYRNRWVVTTHTLPLPDGVTPDAIQVGMYDGPTMIRADTSQHGQPIADDTILVWNNGVP